ncbi:DUF4258 domain-containing protein [Paenibacillus gansuensis]|uniref:DUF4258 domain-containing protein n=1 Tax=Paenibacillus gansuensis TaxID=306542 RepID=A0ABW5PHP0_9BACL
MDYRKDNWSHELECFRKAVNGSIDGYDIDIAEHYIVDRLENDAYADRTYNRFDIAVAIFNGSIIEGYSSEHNRKRKSRVSSMVTPSRLVLGRDLSGNWVIVVIGMLASTMFKVITCYPAISSRHLEIIKEIEDGNC